MKKKPKGKPKQGMMEDKIMMKPGMPMGKPPAKGGKMPMGKKK